MLADDNTVYYAAYSRGFLGRLDLSNGQVKEWASPSGPQSQPYGIAFAKGVSLVQRVVCETHS